MWQDPQSRGAPVHSGRSVHLFRSRYGESTKAVDLQFKNEFVGIERFRAAGEPYRTHPAWKHAGIIAGTILVMCGTASATQLCGSSGLNSWKGGTTARITT